MTIFLFYEGVEIGGEREVGLATAATIAGPYTKENFGDPVMTKGLLNILAGGPFDRVSHPTVWRITNDPIPSTQWKAYTSGRSGGINRIYHFTSPDPPTAPWFTVIGDPTGGHVLKEEASEPWRSGGVANPVFFNDSGNFYVFVSGLNAATGVESIGLFQVVDQFFVNFVVPPGVTNPIITSTGAQSPWTTSDGTTITVANGGLFNPDAVLSIRNDTSVDALSRIRKITGNVLDLYHEIPTGGADPDRHVAEIGSGSVVPTSVERLEDGSYRLFVNAKDPFVLSPGGSSGNSRLTGILTAPSIATNDWTWDYRESPPVPQSIWDGDNHTSGTAIVTVEFATNVPFSFQADGVGACDITLISPKVDFSFEAIGTGFCFITLISPKIPVVGFEAIGVGEMTVDIQKIQNFTFESNGEAVCTILVGGPLTQVFGFEAVGEGFCSIDFANIHNIELIADGAGSCTILVDKVGQQPFELIANGVGVCTISFTGTPKDFTFESNGVGAGIIDVFRKGELVCDLVDVFNTTLAMLGSSPLVTAEDNTVEAARLRENFPEHLRHFLTETSWDRAMVTVPLVELDLGESQPPEWLRAFSLPQDLIREIAFNGRDLGPGIDTRWAIQTNPITKGGTVLYTHDATASLKYVFAVDPNNVCILAAKTRHALAAGLAFLVAPGFAKDSGEITRLEAQYERALQDARGIDGQSGTPGQRPHSRALTVRNRSPHSMRRTR